MFSSGHKRLRKPALNARFPSAIQDKTERLVCLCLALKRTSLKTIPQTKIISSREETKQQEQSVSPQGTVGSDVAQCTCVRVLDWRAEPRDQLFSENRKCLEPVFHMLCALFFFPFFHVFTFSGVSLRGSHIAERATGKFSLLHNNLMWFAFVYKEKVLLPGVYNRNSTMSEI